MARILVSTPDLRPSLFSILRGLNESGILERIATTVSFSPQQIKLLAEVPLVGRDLARILKRREAPAFIAGKVDNIWTRELLRILSARIMNPNVTHALWEWAETSFDRIVARRYGGRFDIVYGMEHSSAATFKVQKASGGRCVLRQVSAHARTINLVLRQETDRFPQFVTLYHRLLMENEEKIAARKETEYKLADLIVANSHYIKKTFIANGVPAGKIVAVPTGCPPVDLVGARSGAGRDALRVLYVGTLSLRKGFPYLLEAWRRAELGPHGELWIAGKSELDVMTELQAERSIRYLGMLARDELFGIYRQADVMVLPTLCEGLAHSALEALSFGLPIITTEASGVGDLVVEGENGFIVPSRDAGALALALVNALEWRTRLPGMGARSAQKAKNWTLEHSNAQHLKHVKNLIPHLRQCDLLNS